MARQPQDAVRYIDAYGVPIEQQFTENVYHPTTGWRTPEQQQATATRGSAEVEEAKRFFLPYFTGQATNISHPVVAEALFQMVPTMMQFLPNADWSQFERNVVDRVRQVPAFRELAEFYDLTRMAFTEGQDEAATNRVMNRMNNIRTWADMQSASRAFQQLAQADWVQPEVLQNLWNSLVGQAMPNVESGGTNTHQGRFGWHGLNELSGLWDQLQRLPLAVAEDGAGLRGFTPVHIPEATSGMPYRTQQALHNMSLAALQDATGRVVGPGGVAYEPVGAMTGRLAPHMPIQTEAGYFENAPAKDDETSWLSYLSAVTNPAIRRVAGTVEDVVKRNPMEVLDAGASSAHVTPGIVDQALRDTSLLGHFPSYDAFAAALEAALPGNPSIDNILGVARGYRDWGTAAQWDEQQQGAGINRWIMNATQAYGQP